MSITSLERSKTLRRYGSQLGREGMSDRVIAAVSEFDGKSLKAAMFLAGRLKAIAQMAGGDDYWAEQVDKGFMRELRNAASPHPTAQPEDEE